MPKKRCGARLRQSDCETSTSDRLSSRSSCSTHPPLSASAPSLTMSAIPADPMQGIPPPIIAPAPVGVVPPELAALAPGAAPPAAPAPAAAPEETASETLYIQNLNEKIKIPVLKASLRGLFKSYGEVLDVVAHGNLRMRGQAFVSFESADVARKALKEVRGFPLYSKPMVSVAFCVLWVDFGWEVERMGGCETSGCARALTCLWAANIVCEDAVGRGREEAGCECPRGA